MTSAQGEDRSSYQDIGPWQNLDFGWCKATEGTSLTDPSFTANWRNLKTQVGHRGAYHFFHPSFSASQQAAFFMDAVIAQGLNRGDMLAIDTEISVGLDGTLLMRPAAADRSALLEPDSKGRAVIQPGTGYPHRLLRRSLPPKLRTALEISGAVEFLDAVRTITAQHLGGSYCPIFLYTYLDFLPQVSECTGYPLWVAAYSGTAPASVAPWTSWTMWQYAGGGGQLGADQDAFNGSRAAMDGWMRCYVPSAPAPAPAPAPNWTETLVDELPALRQGASGGDVRTAQGCLTARFCTVAVDGVFGPSTEAAVRTLQATSHLTQDGVIGPKTWAALFNR